MYKIIKAVSTVPSFNLAWEEYILKNKYQGDDIFFLWQNTPSIIVGRNQNIYREINLDYTFNHHLPIYRRNSGGGTVYHDLGNLNFTFITKAKGKVNNYQLMTKPIIDALNKLNIKATFTPKSHLYLDNKKIGGNAQYLYKDLLLHHGTILFSSDLTTLNNSLLVDDSHISKAIKSNPSLVVNLKDYTNLSLNELFDYLYREIALNAEMVTLDENDFNLIRKLELEKYLNNDWNYFDSPSSNFIKEKANYYLNLELEKGLIKKAIIKYNNEELPSLANLLINKTLLPNELLFLKKDFSDIYNLLFEKR